MNLKAQYEETYSPVFDLSSGAEHRIEQAGNPDFLNMCTVGKDQKFLTIFLETLLEIYSKKMSSIIVFIVVLTMGQAVHLVYRFLNSCYAAGTGNDMIFSVSIFQDQAGADESTRTATDWVKQNLAALIEGPPEIIADEMKTYIAK